VVNLQSNDTQRLMELCPNFHLIWSAPLQIIGEPHFLLIFISSLNRESDNIILTPDPVALVLLYLTIGPSAFVGLAIMILLIPIQGVIAARLGGLRKQLLDKTDSRIKLMNEVLQGIRFEASPPPLFPLLSILHFFLSLACFKCN